MNAEFPWAGRHIPWLACFAALLLPWVNPFSAGPSSSVQPWLVSALCVAVAFAIQPPGRLAPPMVLALAGLAAWASARSGLTPETVALAVACLLILMAAGTAAGGAHRPEFIDAVALAWLLAAALSTAIALCQYFGVAEALAPWVNASATGEAFANLRQRNQFASLTAIGMASLFWLFPGKLGRWTALAAIAWLAVGNASTTSRTGLTQMILLGALACLWPGARRQRALLWLGGLAAYALAALALPWLLELLTGEPGNRLWERVASVETCSSRTVLWSNVLHLVGQRPWAGWGWGELDYAHFATLYEGARFCDILDNAHNLPLHLAVELGIPAAVLLCGGLVWAAVRARPWSEAQPARQMAWAVLAVIGVHSLLEYPLWYGPFQIAFGLGLGLLWPVAAQASQAATGAEPSRPRLASAAAAACVAAACAYAAWDYRRVSQIYLPPEARTPAMRDDPLPEIRRSWLFGNQARFAELTITPLTRENAAWTFDNARELLHYSPEPRVIEKLIESATVLGREHEMLLDLARFRAAFPEAYSKWSKARTGGDAAQPDQPAT
ncbi:MAG: Wzy polymerase domain-containing protein [Ramlibacter sp.]|nr:Wzy polymerase domain-containing protein [Ramlibacter sp.]